MAASLRLTFGVSWLLVLAAAVAGEALRRGPGIAVGAPARDAGQPDALAAPVDADAIARAVAQFDDAPIELGPLEEACRMTLCPAAWSDVLAQSAWFAHDHDWHAFMGCGRVNVVQRRSADAGHAWFFDVATGRLVGFSDYAFFWAAHGQSRFGETPSLEGCAASPWPQPSTGAVAGHPDESIAGDVTASNWKTAQASMKLLCSEPMRFHQVSVFRACKGANTIAASLAFHDPVAMTQTLYWEYAVSTGALIGMGDEYEDRNETDPPLRPTRYGPIPDLSGCFPTLLCAKAPE
jgi:hypothetical protein